MSQSQFSPAFIQMMMGTQQNQQSKLDADMKAMAISAQAQSSKDATDARVALGKLDNETKLVDIATNKETREAEIAAIQMQKDKQEAGISDRHAAEMKYSEDRAAQADKKARFDAEMNALSGAVTNSGNAAMSNISASNFDYLNGNGPSTYDSFADQDAIDDIDKRFGEWSTRKREENGEQTGELTILNRKLRGEEGDALRGLATVMTNGEQRLQKLNGYRSDFQGFSTSLQTDMAENTGMMLNFMTTPDKTQKGFWAGVGSNVEQFLPGISNTLFGVGGKVAMGPGQTYMNLPLADKVFGAGGAYKGWDVSGSIYEMTDDSANHVADLVYNKETGTRANAGKEVASMLSEWGVSTEGIEGMKNQISWEETTLYNQGVSREEYVEAVALKMAHENGREYQTGEEDRVTTVDRMASESSMNPLFDRESLRIMGADKLGDTELSANEKRRLGTIAYSANPKNSLLGFIDFGADAIRARANDGFTSADRYLKTYTREMASGGQFGDIGGVLESANNAIMSYLNTPKGEKNSEKLNATLKELALGNEGQNFILMDSFFDTLSGMQKQNFDETMDKRLHDAGLKQDSELFVGVQKGWDEMVDTLRSVGKTWNASNGARNFGGTQDLHFVEGYQKRMTQELFNEQGKKTYGDSWKDMDTGDPLVIQTVMGDVGSTLWESLPTDLPNHIKEVMFRKQMERLHGITDEYAAAAKETTAAAEDYRAWIETTAREEEGFEDEMLAIDKGAQRARGSKKQEVLDRFLEEE